jgi:endoglucanase Acf2
MNFAHETKALHKILKQIISVPSLDHLQTPPTYYTPNPQDPQGDWIVYEGYYTPTANRLWIPYQSKDIPGMTFAPTNDWFQTLASWPQGGVMSTTGYYNVFWNGTANKGLTFLCPKAFKYYPTLGVPASGHFTIDLSVAPGIFSIIPPQSDTQPQVSWLPANTGNMLRSINYLGGELTLYLSQGGVFQGVKYNHSQVQISIPYGYPVSTSSSTQGLRKYRIDDSHGFSYLIYTPVNINLGWQNQLLTSLQPYSGYLNIVCLPTEVLSQEISSLLDSHARAVIIKAHGAFSSTPTSSYDYTLSYSTVDLLGTKTSYDPLILLMDHQLNKAHLTSTQQQTPLSLLSLKGVLPAYAGNQFQFKFPDTYHSLSTDPLPTPGISQSQAIALIDNQVLDRGLDAAITAPAPTLSIPYNKFLYQKALTLFYAQKIIDLSGRPNTWKSKLSTLYQSLIQGLNNLWKGTSTFPEKINGSIVQQPSGIRKDSHWGTIVFFPDSYGSAISLNDHIVQYGYPLYALTLLDQYETMAEISSKYLNQTSVISPYTNKDLGNFLALDMGQSDGNAFIAHRNLDFYEGHSWLSGLGISNDGQNTESESEALLGSMSVLAWLKQTNQDPALIQIAKNRWLLETSSYQSYWQVDPNTTPYQKVCPEYVADHLLSSMVWQNKITAETYWGLEWDRILACIFMPASANLLDNYLGASVPPAYAKQIADYVQANWATFDTTNTIQSVLIPLVARSATGVGIPPLGLPAVVQNMIDDVKEGKTQFDAGTNELILTIIAMYAQNQYK